MSAILAAVVCLGDYVTGPDVSFALFYLVPVFLAAGTAGAGAGVVVSVLSAVSWSTADVVTRVVAYDNALIPLWNGSVRFFMFWLVSALVASLRGLAAQERELSRTDPLSGLANTRGFFDLASRELARAKRTRCPLSVAYIDIDDFKAVNDGFGHTEGDEVIMRTGEVLLGRVRATDIVGRVGGDEFVIVLPETDSSPAEAAVASIHDALTDMAKSEGWPIGFSVGVVTFGTMPHSIDELIRRADALMYEVKTSAKGGIRFERDRYAVVHPRTAAS